MLNPDLHTFLLRICTLGVYSNISHGVATLIASATHLHVVSAPPTPMPMRCPQLPPLIESQSEFNSARFSAGFVLTVFVAYAPFKLCVGHQITPALTSRNVNDALAVFRMFAPSMPVGTRGDLNTSRPAWRFFAFMWMAAR